METSSKWADFGKRFATGVIGAPLVLGAIVAGSPWYLALGLLVILAAAYELQHIIYPEQLPILPFVLIMTTILGTVSGYAMVIFILLAIGILSGPFWIQSQTDLTSEWRRAYSPLVATSIIVGCALSSFYLIREGNDGLAWIIFLLISVWGTDVFALIGGRLWGKRKLAPTISAGKTIEGAITGIVMGTVGGLVVAILADLPWLAGLVFAFCITLVAILGDLAESKVKRFYNVKDSGSILPGHGGILDRIDGLMPSAIFLFIMTSLIF